MNSKYILFIFLSLILFSCCSVSFIRQASDIDRMTGKAVIYGEVNVCSDFNNHFAGISLLSETSKKIFEVSFYVSSSRNIFFMTGLPPGKYRILDVYYTEMSTSWNGKNMTTSTYRENYPVIDELGDNYVVSLYPGTITYIGSWIVKGGSAHNPVKIGSDKVKADLKVPKEILEKYDTYTCIPYLE